MRRKDSHVGFGKSFDSFLSIVTKNGLGMLILIAMATTFTSQQALSQAKFRKSLGTPLVKTAPKGMRPVHFECRGGRIVPIEFKVVEEPTGKFFQASGPQLDALAKEYNAAAFSNEYYTFEFQSHCGDPPFPNEAAVMFKPVGKAVGDTAEAVKNPYGFFRQRLKTLDPNQHAIILFVRGDSFEFFRTVREVVQAEGFRIGWHPFDKPLKLYRGGGGGDFPID